MSVRGSRSFRQKQLALMCGLALPGVASCLDSAPTYVDQKRIPPFVIVPSVTPRLDEVAQVATNKSLQVRVPFRSEDLGEPLNAVFALDRQYQGTDELGPSVFEDTTRVIEFTLRPELDPGCYQLSMVLSHEDNLLQGTSVVDESQAAYLYWWVELFDPQTGATAQCPSE